MGKDIVDEIKELIGDQDSNQSVSNWLSTGILPLNKAISGDYNKGFPVGRITEIYGAESCGKTLQATMAMIETQRKGGVALYLDYECAFDVVRAMDLGLNSDVGWFYKQPKTAEEGFIFFEQVCELFKKSHPDKLLTIVFDSIASMIPKEELEAGFDKANMKTKLALASFLSIALKRAASIISGTNTTLIFLNQVRDNPGVMFGDKEKTPGGNAPKFYSSLRIRLRKGAKVKDDDGKDITGEEITALTVKNKVYRPFVESKYVSSFMEGVDLFETHVRYLEELGKLGNSKGWVELNGEKMRRKDLINSCRADHSIYEQLLSLFIDQPEN